MFYPNPAVFSGVWMRPLPIVAGGASGGIVGLCVQVAREIFFSDPVIRVPPSPILLGGSTSAGSFELRFDWISFLLGLVEGVLIWPLLDLALLPGFCWRGLSGGSLVFRLRGFVE